jgi:hypothetical protein
MTQPLDIMEYTHCLRPGFTRELIDTLIERRRSVNLFGPPGCGKRRQLEDLRDCRLPETLALLLDLRLYRRNYTGFLTALWRQVPPPGRKTPQTLGQLIGSVQANGQQVLLLFDNFDALLDKADLDPQFNARFHNHLNSIKNHPRIALVCVSAKPHDHSAVLVKGQSCGTSWLGLDKLPLPELSRQELRAEVMRQRPELDDSTAALIAKTVHAKEKNYALLVTILKHWENPGDAGLSVDQRLERWGRLVDAAQGSKRTSGLDRWLKALRQQWATPGQSARSR